MRVITNPSCLFFFLIGITINYHCLSQEKSSLKKQDDALQNYIRNSDSSFQWENYKRVKEEKGTYYEVNLVSQKWQGIIWKHNLVLYFPSKVRYPGTMLIVLSHLYNLNEGINSLKIISDSTGTPAALLYNIPNQPLFEGKEEDDLQAYTFYQFLKTGDESWPLLMPMVKSVVKSMDAVQLISSKESIPPINDFIIAGHSKRGHTTWLAAAADVRVKGIIPIAIDILNSSKQMLHQLEVFGEYSTPSESTTAFLRDINNPRGHRLIEMIDAYSYKEKLTLPKLIVSGTNDQFFTTDALNLYWDGLVKPKWVLYLPNSNHVQAYSDPRTNPTAFAFVRAIASNKSLPSFTWEFRKLGESLLLNIKTDSSAVKARLWSSNSPNKDFRLATWSPHSIGVTATANKNKSKASSKEFKIIVPIPTQGFMAVFGEVEFEQDGHVFLLSTQTNISTIEE